MEEKNSLICDTPVRLAGKSVLGVLKYAWRRFLIIFTRLILMLNNSKLIVLIKKLSQVKLKIQLNLKMNLHTQETCKK